MLHTINIINSTLASSIRGWRGTSCTQSLLQPSQELFLFEREGDPECRLVRETLTALNLDVTIMPCPLGGKNIRRLRHEVKSETVPVLFDANVEEHRTGAEEIIKYLYKQYKGVAAPARSLPNKKALRASKLSSLLRLNAGTTARKTQGAELPLKLYSFESSPFSRPVRELLCELELPYKLINLGKQQRADMGPAKFRFNIGTYKPIENSKRDQFNAEHGNVQVPYLEDPNTGAGLFESDEIIRYLKLHYAI